MYTGIQLRAADTRRAPFDQVVVVFAARPRAARRARRARRRPVEPLGARPGQRAAQTRPGLSRRVDRLPWGGLVGRCHPTEFGPPARVVHDVLS